MDPEDNILELEEGGEDTGNNSEDSIAVVNLSEDALGAQPIQNIIATYLGKLKFGFYKTTINPSGTSGKRKYVTVSFDEMIQNDALNIYFSPQTITLYNDVVTNGNVNQLANLVTSANSDMNTRADQAEGRTGVLDKPIEDSAKGASVYTFSPKKKDQVDIAELTADIQKTITSEDFIQAREQEAINAETNEQLDVQDTGEVIRTSHPYWGYKTTRAGTVPSVLLTDENGLPEDVPAPFSKGAEYRMFTDMDPSALFILQRRMVAAGMDAPPVDEYGQWTKREANFISAVFIKATDSGNWEKDQAANRPLWETTLTNLQTEIGETEDFIKLLNEANYLGEQQSISPEQMQKILDEAAGVLGITFTPDDYVKHAELVNQTFGQAAALQRDYQNALVTDRDLILNAEIRDPRAIQSGEFPMFLPGSKLPIVLPSYETLRGEKGELPVVKSQGELLVEGLRALPEIQGEIASGEDLEAIKYAANLFEASMGQVDLGAQY
jgi:hypothetical protein